MKRKRNPVKPSAGAAPEVEPKLSAYADVLIKAALFEDIGPGDITTKATVPPAMTGVCKIIAKEDIVVAGLFVAQKTFGQLDNSADFRCLCKDGDAVKKGRTIAMVTGALGALLTAERVAVNFLQRMSGVATLTREFVAKTRGTKARILDTRKTTPCMRMLERYAVRAGGGSNHRFGLFDCILIKDNHIKAAGGVKKAVEAVYKKYHEVVPVEVEVTNFKEVKEAVAGGADIIMLDNMPVARIKKALRIIDSRAFVEVSGGINLSNVRAVAKTGVDFISVGALTHSARAVDISMEVVSYESSGRRG